VEDIIAVACGEECVATERAAALVAMSLPRAAPPPSLRDRLMARVHPEPTPYTVAPGLDSRLLLSGDGEWKKVSPGITSKPLHYDSARRTSTFLLRLEPGAVLGAHVHGGTEQCLVLEGEVEDGGTTLRKGDFQVLGKESLHPASWSKTGCVLLIVAEEAAATRFV
jgi:anti-sigma factor ChrR (cupin superfamily)